MKNLKDKVVFITGGARGLGYASAEKFAAEGAKIVIGDILEDLSAESAKKLADEFGVETMGIGMDVTKVESIKEAFGKVKERFGRLDVQINCAGIQIRCPAKEFSEENWDKLMGVNLKGVFFCCQAAANLMGDKGGAIVNFSSGTVQNPTPGRAPYVISKGGVNAMTAVLADEWGKDCDGHKAIRVNAVAPGWILTNMLQDGMKLGIVSHNQLMAAIPFERYAQPSEIADAVVFLASDEASYITGQTLVIDGGQTSLGLPSMDYLK